MASLLILVTLFERGCIQCFKHYCAFRGQMKENSDKAVMRRIDFLCRKGIIIIIIVIIIIAHL
jgi:hypothetical protein